MTLTCNAPVCAAAPNSPVYLPTVWSEGRGSCVLSGTSIVTPLLRMSRLDLATSWMASSSKRESSRPAPSTSKKRYPGRLICPTMDESGDEPVVLPTDTAGGACLCAKPAGRSRTGNWTRNLTVIGLNIRSLNDTVEYLPVPKTPVGRIREGKR